MSIASIRHSPCLNSQGHHCKGGAGAEGCYNHKSKLGGEPTVKILIHGAKQRDELSQRKEVEPRAEIFSPWLLWAEHNRKNIRGVEDNYGGHMRLWRSAEVSLAGL